MADREVKNTKIWISQEWKELLRWNKKHFSQGYHFWRAITWQKIKIWWKIADTSFKRMIYFKGFNLIIYFKGLTHGCTVKSFCLFYIISLYTELSQQFFLMGTNFFSSFRWHIFVQTNRNKISKMNILIISSQFK